MILAFIFEKKNVANSIFGFVWFLCQDQTNDSLTNKLRY